MMEFTLYASAWVAMMLIVAWRLGVQLAMVVVTLKVAVFVTLWTTTGWEQFPMKDGNQYFKDGRSILEKYTPVSVVTRPKGREVLSQLAGYGPHQFYGWWNSLVQWTVGDVRLALPAVNVVFAALMALLLGQLALACGAGMSYANGLVVLAMLYPDILVWSSLTNTKDTMIAMFVVLAFLSLVRLRNCFGLSWLLALGFSLAMLIGLRYYLVVLILGSALGATLLGRWRLRTFWFLAALAMLAMAFVYFMEAGFLIKHASRLDLGEIPGGVLKYLLSPRPWSIDETHWFLFVPSLWHWIMAAPAAIGGYWLWREYPEVRSVLIFFVVVVLFYAAEESLRGPRQRLQVDFIILWAQFHFFFHIVRVFANTRQPLMPRAGAHGR